MKGKTIVSDNQKKFDSISEWIKYRKSLPPDDLSFLSGEVSICDNPNNLRKIISSLSRRIKINPNSSIIYYTRGVLRYKCKQYPKAIDDFTHHLSLERNFGLSYYWRGLAKYALDRKEDALIDFKMAVEKRCPEGDEAIKEYYS